MNDFCNSAFYMKGGIDEVVGEEAANKKASGKKEAEAKANK